MEGTAVPILTIEKCFCLSDGRLLIAPDFPVFEGFNTPTTLRAQLQKQDGSSVDCQVTLTLVHFNILNSSDVEKRWRITPELQGLQKSDVAPGDRLCIYDKSVAAQLLRQDH